MKTLGHFCVAVVNGVVGGVAGALAGLVAGAMVALVLACARASYAFVTIGPVIPGYLPFDFRIPVASALLGALVGVLNVVSRLPGHE